ncbi:SDR family NAD(P)-dependent oxidoreductase [Denitrobaculum tricleocarpae]|uniref:SDR family oxidoreductase n=1 Tax=Denitrobaculum tricleocarpae TaxID=2591009 RepID=A0A545TEX3_9PROT|nr:SDR family oxidoreductase [Denitrobaculum tricleocarpae]TQV75735.1 SDR family oxidoreductase [Denitrobaculum tricleocarpae]
MTQLAGKHALVTGGGTGVGAAIARRLAAAGAKITLAGRRREPLEATAAEIPGAAMVQADVTDEAAVREMFEAARAAQGPVDILVANAGAAESVALKNTSLDQWERMLSVNLTGSFLCAREALADMLESDQGRVVFVSSTAGLKGYPYVAAYCAAKHGVVGLTRAMASELAKTGITVNAVCPGFTETPLLADSIAKIVEKTGRSEEDARKSLAASNPQGRFVQPEEVAESVVWLCASGSGSVTGQAISISGGEVT